MTAGVKLVPKVEMASLQQAVDFLKKKCGELPPFAMALGSGLNPVADRLEIEVQIPYSEIPNCPLSTVPGHKGRLIVGKLGGHRICVMQGRMHFYEGHSLTEVVFLFRAVALAGAKIVFVTNAAGALHNRFVPGELMLIQDHINFMGLNPLIGPNIEELGPRFPNLMGLYDPKLRDCFVTAAKAAKLPLREGVYVALNGPSYETPAEVRLYQQIGGDAVGMSTAPEAIALRHMGARVVGMSCITNLAAGVTDQAANHEEVLEAGRKVVEPFCTILIGALHEMERRNEI